MKLLNLAKVIRSKNSGPFELTYDVIFKSRSIYDRIKKENIINKAFVSKVIKVTDKKILKICYFDPVGAVKITIARTVPSGALGDTDIYGAQQHMPLVNAEIKWRK